MARYNGLIIPRSYNDYFSRSDPQAIRYIVSLAADEELNAESKNPLQNQAIAKIVPVTASPDNKLIVQSQVETIKNIIPNTASENNQLADKNFVNSTVGTNTAIFRGTFNSVAELEAYAGEKTNNDYAFVIDEDSVGNTEYNRYKYDGTAWEYEYTLNNSSFTAEQWAAIQSGITAELVAKIGAELPTPTDADKLIISQRDGEALKWVEIDKDKVGEITTKCTKEEWNAKPLEERKALAGSAVDILDDYDEVDNNVYSTEEVVVGKWKVDGVEKNVYRCTLNIGSIPHGTNTKITHNKNMDKVIKYDGFAYFGNNWHPIPYISNENYKFCVNSFSANQIDFNVGYENNGTYITIEYTKNE